MCTRPSRSSRSGVIAGPPACSSTAGPARRLRRGGLGTRAARGSTDDGLMTGAAPSSSPTPILLPLSSPLRARRMARKRTPSRPARPSATETTPPHAGERRSSAGRRPACGGGGRTSRAMHAGCGVPRSQKKKAGDEAGLRAAGSSRSGWIKPGRRAWRVRRPGNTRGYALISLIALAPLRLRTPARRSAAGAITACVAVRRKQAVIAHPDPRRPGSRCR